MTEFSAPHHTALAQLTGPGAPFEVTAYEIDGISLKGFKHVAKSVADIMAPGRTFGDKLFLQYLEDRYTFSEFFHAADRLALTLQSKYGIKKGDRVAIAMRNCPEWVITFVAIINAGATAVPLNSWGKTEELHQGLTDSEAVLVVCDKERHQFIRAAQSSLPAIVVEPDKLDDASHAFWSLLERVDVSDWTIADIHPEDPAILLFTSGTSGKPKGAMFSHFNCCQALMNVELIGATTYMTNTETMTQQLASPTPPKTLLAVPLFHISGLFSQFIMNLRHGRGIFMMYKWSADEAVKQVKQEKITVLMGASAMLLDLLQHPDFDTVDTSVITNVSAGGGATPEKLHTLYRTKLTAAMPGAGWGLTETGGSGAAFTGAMAAQRPGASGFPSPIVDFKFCDEEGQALPQGQPGEIWVKSAACITHYFSGASDSSDFDDGWFKTGDVGYLNEDGLLYICDRVKDMIIRGGENIYPIEIENCLLQFPGCAEVAVVAIESERYGEEPAAVIRLHDSAEQATAEQVKAFCAERLAGFKVPVEVHFAHEPMPRTATEKLIKADIKRAFFG
jgi:long-chain acyl-CoA synthetase